MPRAALCPLGAKRRGRSKYSVGVEAEERPRRRSGALLEPADPHVCNMHPHVTCRYILTLTYGTCFGVELTMNNVTASYFYEYRGK